MYINRQLTCNCFVFLHKALNYLCTYAYRWLTLRCEKVTSIDTSPEQTNDRSKYIISSLAIEILCLCSLFFWSNLFLMLCPSYTCSLLKWKFCSVKFWSLNVYPDKFSIEQCLLFLYTVALCYVLDCSVFVFCFLLLRSIVIWKYNVRKRFQLCLLRFLVYHIRTRNTELQSLE